MVELTKAFLVPLAFLNHAIYVSPELSGMGRPPVHHPPFFFIPQFPNFQVNLLKDTLKCTLNLYTHGVALLRGFKKIQQISIYNTA